MSFQHFRMLTRSERILCSRQRLLKRLWPISKRYISIPQWQTMLSKKFILHFTGSLRMNFSFSSVFLALRCFFIFIDFFFVGVTLVIWISNIVVAVKIRNYFSIWSSMAWFLCSGTNWKSLGIFTRENETFKTKLTVVVNDFNKWEINLASLYVGQPIVHTTGRIRKSEFFTIPYKKSLIFHNLPDNIRELG